MCPSFYISFFFLAAALETQVAAKERLSFVNLSDLREVDPQPGHPQPDNISFIAVIHSMQHHYAESDVYCEHPILVMELHDSFPNSYATPQLHNNTEKALRHLQHRTAPAPPSLPLPIFLEVCKANEKSVMRYQPGQCIYVEVCVCSVFARSYFLFSVPSHPLLRLAKCVAN
jgi:hypothetical protein